jgi:hypothetical protein
MGDCCRTPGPPRDAGERLVCYCFDESEASIRAELREHGRSGAVERIRAHIAARRCACETRNPRGVCCLGDLIAVVKRLTDEYQAEGAPVCRLPVADRAQRAADFRALLADSLVDRRRVADGVRWTLRGDSATEAESHRLAALEARCCDGVRFDVTREDDLVVWTISGPPSASRVLDAFHELPVVVMSDARAHELWDTLDTAPCGASESRVNEAPAAGVEGKVDRLLPLE